MSLKDELKFFLFTRANVECLRCEGGCDTRVVSFRVKGAVV